jgi:hypothetical protein
MNQVLLYNILCILWRNKDLVMFGNITLFTFNVVMLVQHYLLFMRKARVV